METDERLRQYSNALFPMEVTELGMETEVSLLQP